MWWKWVVGAAVVVGCVGVACLIPATAPWMAKAAVVAVKGVTFGKVALVATTATGALTTAATAAVGTAGTVLVTAGVVGGLTGVAIGVGDVRPRDNKIAAQSQQLVKEQKKTEAAQEETEKLKVTAKTKNQEYFEQKQKEAAPLKQADSAKELARTATEREAKIQAENTRLQARNAEREAESLAAYPAPPTPAPAVHRPSYVSATKRATSRADEAEAAFVRRQELSRTSRPTFVRRQGNRTSCPAAPLEGSLFSRLSRMFPPPVTPQAASSNDVPAATTILRPGPGLHELRPTAPRAAPNDMPPTASNDTVPAPTDAVNLDAPGVRRRRPGAGPAS